MRNYKFNTSKYIKMPPNPIWVSGWNMAIEAMREMSNKTKEMVNSYRKFLLNNEFDDLSKSEIALAINIIEYMKENYMPSKKRPSKLKCDKKCIDEFNKKNGYKKSACLCLHRHAPKGAECLKCGGVI